MPDDEAIARDPIYRERAFDAGILELCVRRIVLSKALFAGTNRARTLRSGSTGIDARLRNGPISPRAWLIHLQALPRIPLFPGLPLTKRDRLRPASVSAAQV